MELIFNLLDMLQTSFLFLAHDLFFLLMPMENSVRRDNLFDKLHLIAIGDVMSSNKLWIFEPQIFFN
jgi:hypothetical protein